MRAFEITDAAGSGFADSAPYTNSYVNNRGQDVYYNRLMSNNVGDEWTGSMTFTVKAPATPGQQLIRNIDGNDYTNDVSAITSSEIRAPVRVKKTT